MILKKQKAIWKRAASKTSACGRLLAGFYPIMNLNNPKNLRATASAGTFYVLALHSFQLSNLYFSKEKVVQ
ncbi:hypothetical protein YSY43_37300 [Paenibacillus sp. YSY-4.3]